MKYTKQEYDLLRKGFPQDGTNSFSKNMKENMQSNRMSMLADVIDYLEESNTPYQQDGFNVVFNSFHITPDLKVFFNGFRKGYQYNYEKVISLIKERC